MVELGQDRSATNGATIGMPGNTGYFCQAATDLTDNQPKFCFYRVFKLKPLNFQTFKFHYEPRHLEKFP